MNRNPFTEIHNHGSAPLRVLRARRERLLASQSRVARAAALAFTLVELLTVIAITVILLGLLFGPIIQGFNFTRRARAIAQAQDAARFGLERLSRELGAATYIYDNISSTIVLPMQAPGVQRNITALDGYDPAAPNTWSYVAFGRIDFVAAATRDAGGVKDPTTGRPVGGAELRPFTRGTRVVRYFLGLKTPNEINPDTGVVTPRYYENVYEFPRTDDGFNPVVLYRAEFDPTDPNLFNQDPQQFNSAGVNSGGFNDPNFFYNTDVADSTNTAGVTGNNRSYAANWRAIARPVIASENVDLVAWNRTGALQNDPAFRRNEVNATDPFKPTVSFAPAAVSADTATPGFLENTAAESPGAVPTLYTAKYGQWTLPFRVTFLRGAAGYEPGSPRANEPYGSLSLEFYTAANGSLQVTPVSSGSLTTPNSDLYVSLSPSNGRYFVKTPDLAFLVDPDRGRIETGLPPLQGQSGVPYIARGNAVAAMVPGTTIFNTADPAQSNYGELIETRFVASSRWARANAGGNVIAADGTPVDILTNQGIVEADVFAQPVTQNGSLLLGHITADTVPTGQTAGAGLQSPLDVFGTNNAAGNPRGIMVVPGSERVFGPDPSAYVTSRLVPYVRVPALAGQNNLGQRAAVTDNDVIPDPALAPRRMYADLAPIPTRYQFDYAAFEPDTGATRQLARVRFASGLDNPLPDANGQDNNAQAAAARYPGLPARRPSQVGNGNLLNLQSGRTGYDDSYIQVTYLWQNNYSRNGDIASFDYGMPLTASLENFDQGSTGRPEADVVKVDYSTRALINVQLGARVYDVATSTAQSVTVSDKIQVNNVGR